MIGLLMEQADAGDLRGRLSKTQPKLTAGESRRFFGDLTNGLEYIQAKGICHLDMKPENLLFSNDAVRARLRIADFGLARRFRLGGKMIRFTSSAGTPEYQAPEVLNRLAYRYYEGEPADIWAAGIILFEMLTGELPWTRADSTDDYYWLAEEKHDNSTKWKRLGQLATNLLLKLEWTVAILLLGTTNVLGRNILYPKTCLDSQEQSPIDIETVYTFPAVLPPLQFTGYDTVLPSINLRNNGETVRVTPNAPNGTAISIAGGGLVNKYNLDQFHFHWGPNSDVGSEHKINGEPFSLEIHFVHINELYPDLATAVQHRDGLVVLSVLAKVSDIPNEGLSEIVAVLDTGLLTEVSSSISTSLSTIIEQILPEDVSKFYRYRGSLTTSGYDQIVDWVVLSEHITLSEDQIKGFRSLKKEDGSLNSENYREVQPLNGRLVLRTF